MINLKSFIVLLTFGVLFSGLPLPGQEEKSKDSGTKKEENPKKDEEKKSEPKLSEGVLARVNGYDIRFDDYTRFLLALYGKTKLKDLIDRILVEQEAQKLEVVVPHDEISKAVDAQISQVVSVLFKGDRSKFEKTYLKTQGMTLEEYRDFIAQKKAYDLLYERCIKKNRAKGEAPKKALMKLFTQKYGEDGVQYELRHILVSTRKKTGQAKAPLTEAQALARAEQIAKEAREGADFVGLVRKYSDDSLSRRRDGKVRRYRKTLYGKKFHAYLEKLSNEDAISSPVRSSRGFHVIQLIDKKVTSYEDKKKELTDLYLNNPPTEAERQAFISRLRKEGKIIQAQ